MSNKANSMGVIFDLDGVLVDTGWAHKQSWFDLAEKEGFSMSDEFFYSTFGMQNYTMIRIKAMMSRCSVLQEYSIDRGVFWSNRSYALRNDDELR